MLSSSRDVLDDVTAKTGRMGILGGYVFPGELVHDSFNMVIQGWKQHIAPNLWKGNIRNISFYSD